MRAIACTVFALGLLGGCITTDTTISSLREAAVKWEGAFPCMTWDCECAYKHQRGCCCAANDLREVEEQIFMRVMDLAKRLHELGDSALQVTGEMKVAFTASLSPRTDCFGPFSSNKPIPYDVITLNHGRGYNPALGVFTAPCAGLYSFSISVYSKVAMAGDRMYHKVQLKRNGEVIASTWEDNRDDTEDSSSQTVLLALQRGGQVYAELLNSRQICGSVKGLNSFSGTLLYPISA